MYTVEIHPHAEKQFYKLPLYKLPQNVQETLEVAILKLENDPRPAGCKKMKEREGYRIRVGDYRIIYEVFDRRRLVRVTKIGHRRDIYD